MRRVGEAAGSCPSLAHMRQRCGQPHGGASIKPQVQGAVGLKNELLAMKFGVKDNQALPMSGALVYLAPAKRRVPHGYS